GGQRDLTAPVQPFRAALVAPLGPTEAVVEVADQLEHAVRGRMQRARETADGDLELVDLAAVDGDTRRRSGHLETPFSSLSTDLELYLVRRRIQKKFQLFTAHIRLADGSDRRSNCESP